MCIQDKMQKDSQAGKQLLSLLVQHLYRLIMSWVSWAPLVKLSQTDSEYSCSSGIFSICHLTIQLFGFSTCVCGWYYYWYFARCQLDVICPLQKRFPAQKEGGSTCPACVATGCLRRRLRGLRLSIHAERVQEVIWHLLTVQSCKRSSTPPFLCESYMNNVCLHLHHVSLLSVSRADVLCVFVLGKPLCGYGWRDWGEKGRSRLGLWSRWVLHGGLEAVRGGALRWPWVHWDSGEELSVLDDTSTSVKKV